MQPGPARPRREIGRQRSDPCAPGAVTLVDTRSSCVCGLRLRRSTLLPSRATGVPRCDELARAYAAPRAPPLVPPLVPTQLAFAARLRASRSVWTPRSHRSGAVHRTQRCDGALLACTPASHARRPTGVDAVPAMRVPSYAQVAAAHFEAERADGGGRLELRRPRPTQAKSPRVRRAFRAPGLLRRSSPANAASAPATHSRRIPPPPSRTLHLPRCARDSRRVGVGLRPRPSPPPRTRRPRSTHAVRNAVPSPPRAPRAARVVPHALDAEPSRASSARSRPTPRSQVHPRRALRATDAAPPLVHSPPALRPIGIYSTGTGATPDLRCLPSPPRVRVSASVHAAALVGLALAILQRASGPCSLRGADLPLLDSLGVALSSRSKPAPRSSPSPGAPSAERAARSLPRAHPAPPLRSPLSAQSPHDAS
ncbi:hypothetical protein B0H15DRAFT_163039 [Mycena belliarum]|uniref:Uncharacterized protein n=1 Tax=Mycena belliarum TaxID=1033014 RepID=A0AAD6XWG5_9AGAR|nr:hypothetical protein B0H15DRAFT_163039 [Mycena belliae]